MTKRTRRMIDYVTECLKTFGLGTSIVCAFPQVANVRGFTLGATCVLLGAVLLYFKREE